MGIRWVLLLAAGCGSSTTAPALARECVGDLPEIGTLVLADVIVDGVPQEDLSDWEGDARIVARDHGVDLSIDDASTSFRREE